MRYEKKKVESSLKFPESNFFFNSTLHFLVMEKSGIGKYKSVGSSFKFLALVFVCVFVCFFYSTQHFLLVEKFRI